MSSIKVNSRYLPFMSIQGIFNYSLFKISSLKVHSRCLQLKFIQDISTQSPFRVSSIKLNSRYLQLNFIQDIFNETQFNISKDAVNHFRFNIMLRITFTHYLKDSPFKLFIITVKKFHFISRR